MSWLRRRRLSLFPDLDDGNMGLLNESQFSGSNFATPNLDDINSDIQAQASLISSFEILKAPLRLTLLADFLLAASCSPRVAWKHR